MISKKFIIFVCLMITCAILVSSCDTASEKSSETDYTSYFYIEDTTEDKIKTYITDDGKFKYSYFKDGICINQYLGNEKNITLPEKIEDKYVIKLGLNIEYPEQEGIEGIVYQTGFENISFITIPSNLKYISNTSLDIDGLRGVFVSKDNSYYFSDRGVLYTKDKKVLLIFPNNYDNAEYQLLNGVKIINDTCTSFRVSNGKKYIFDIPASVERILDFSSLPEVNISDKNENYSSEDGNIYSKDKTILFGYNPASEKKIFTIPNTVKTIHKSCRFFTKFYGYNDNIRTVNIPRNLEKIDINLSSEIPSLCEYVVDKDNKNFSSKDGVLFDKKQSILIAYPGSKPEKLYSIPESVEKFNWSVFNYSNNLDSLIINKNVINIEGQVSDIYNKIQIKGYKDTESERFAYENGIPFYEIS